MKILGQSPPARPAEIRAAEDLPLYEMDFDLCQKEGLAIAGDPEYVTQETLSQIQVLGTGIFMGLFQFASMLHELAHKNIRLFGAKVLPMLKKGDVR